MPGNWSGWLYGLGADGTPFELINHARTAAYLRGVGMPNGMMLCDVLADDGCAALPYLPPCPQPVESHVEFPADATAINSLSVPDSASFSAPAQLDLRFALGGLQTSSGGATSRLVAMHGTTSATGRAWYVSVLADNTLHLVTSTGGAAGFANTSLEPLTGNDEPVLGRVTWRGSDGRVQFLRKPTEMDEIAANLADDAGWDQIGVDQTSTQLGTLFNATAPLTLGNRGAADSAFEGDFYGFWLAVTIDGTRVVELGPTDITDAAATSFTATSGQTVTVTRAGSGPQLSLFVDSYSGWNPQTYTAPDVDGAPWYSANAPASADALGFWVEQWTGLDNTHVTRNVQARGGSGGGGQLGVLSANERVMSLNVLLFARSEAAMEHLYRWLEQTLSNVCATCSTDSMLIRRYCPATLDDLWEGVAKLNQVGLIGGPQWEEEPLPFSACYLRRVNFTLAAGDPCMYGSGVEVAQDVMVADLGDCLPSLTVAETRHPCRPTCPEMTGGTNCRSSFFYDVPASAEALVPVVTMANPNVEYTLPVRVIVYADPLGVEAAPGVTDPCGLQILGEIYVRALRPGATFVWDVAARDVLYSDHSTGGFAPGWAYVDPNDPPERRWFALPCGQIVITVELATLCLEPLGGGAYSDGIHTFTAPRYPSLTLEILPRFGCP